MEDTISTIELVSTQELIDELKKRCEHMLFIGAKPEEFAPYTYWYNVSGNSIMCNGLYVELKTLMGESSVQETQDEEST